MRISICQGFVEFQKKIGFLIKLNIDQTGLYRVSYELMMGNLHHDIGMQLRPTHWVQQTDMVKLLHGFLQLYKSFPIHVFWHYYLLINTGVLDDTYALCIAGKQRVVPCASFSWKYISRVQEPREATIPLLQQQLQLEHMCWSFSRNSSCVCWALMVVVSVKEKAQFQDRVPMVTHTEKCSLRRNWLGISAKEGDIGPLRLLLLIFKCLNLARRRSGMGPERELFWRRIAVSPVRFCTLNGISPSKVL